MQKALLETSSLFISSKWAVAISIIHFFTVHESCNRQNVQLAKNILKTQSPSSWPTQNVKWFLFIADNEQIDDFSINVWVAALGMIYLHSAK